MAATARFSPSFSTMVSAMRLAEPVLMRAPAKMPEVMIRRTEDIMLWAPEIMKSTVVASPPPPMMPPMRAPRIRLYAG